ncbi:MAG: respiratory nitrate reductase subunit gamma [Thermodesulfobacteriota bacterium]
MTRLKKLLFLSVFLAGLLGGAGPAPAEWFLNAESFHASVHGQLACSDCHQGLDKARHPDPALVNRRPADFFNPDQCAGCHDSLETYLAQGVHGQVQVKTRQDIENCLKCHHPHDQQPVGGKAVRYDPKLPPARRCAACHELRTSLPVPAVAERECYSCHAVEPGKTKATEDAVFKLCFHCHAAPGLPPAPWFNLEAFRQTPHGRSDCLNCHPGSARFVHKTGTAARCLNCHRRHDEKKARDAHLTVQCQACHMVGVKPARRDGFITAQAVRTAGEPSRVHDLADLKDESACRRCHNPGNNLGASAAIPPAKGILCLACHTATLSLADPITIIALVLFLAGLANAVLILGSGAASDSTRNNHPGQGGTSRGHAAWKRLAATLFLDVLLQARLFKRSVGRWLVHGLIFFPLVFRFVWGTAGLVASNWFPEWPGAWVLVDKNHPATAFLFDLSGLLMLLGAVLMMARKIRERSIQPPGLSSRELLDLGLLEMVLLSGFLVEGLRLAMTGAVDGAAFSFTGSLIGALFSDAAWLTGAYAWFWYGHAILYGIFVAYLPFSRLLHLILAPAALLLASAPPRRPGKG